MDFSHYTEEDFLSLYDRPLSELVEIAHGITQKNFGNSVEACSIISAKTGICGEDCKYCSQSAHHHTDIHCHPLLDLETIKKAAQSARDNGATRFCIVTSGRLPNDNDFPKILEMVRAVASIDGLHCCASLGILTEEQVKQLKDAGLERYNHNINTSSNYYGKICTTHTFADRVRTVKLIKKYSIEACCGVILGMGETRRDRVSMALTLRDLDPISTTLNFLTPIKGTPLENYGDRIDEDEILRSICIFRIALPRVLLRYAGGRTTRLSKKNQEFGFSCGINAILIGNYLTTTGASPSEDKALLKKLDLQLIS